MRSQFNICTKFIAITKHGKLYLNHLMFPLFNNPLEIRFVTTLFITYKAVGTYIKYINSIKIEVNSKGQLTDFNNFTVQLINWEPKYAYIFYLFNVLRRIRVGYSGLCQLKCCRLQILWLIYNVCNLKCYFPLTIMKD